MSSPHAPQGPRGRNVRTRPTPAGSRGSAQAGLYGTLLASAIGFAAAASIAGGIAWSSGCRGESPPGASADAPPRTSHLAAPTATARADVTTSGSTEPAPRAARDDAGAPPANDKPYTGPLLGALALQTPIYPT